MSGLRSAGIPLLAGAVFGLGLAISGMADPATVLAFLDLASGHWNPQLAFVMGGAILVTLPAFALAARRGVSLPPRTPVTLPLVAGTTIFGLGWGITGVCPGPALVLATGGGTTAALFLLGLLAGMVLFGRLKLRPRTPPPADRAAGA